MQISFAFNREQASDDILVFYAMSGRQEYILLLNAYLPGALSDC